MSESKSNILDAKTGFNTRVNLYIIRYIYYHMKKDDQFMEEGKGIRKKSIPLESLIFFSRQRFARIFAGENYQVTKEESQILANMFNIDTDYFKKDAELIEVHGLGVNDWKTFFRYLNTSQKIEKWDKAMEELKRLVIEDYIFSHYDTSAPLYRIYYYFKKGVTFKEVTPFHKFLENLELIKISDWKELDNSSDDMTHYLDLLKKHYEYVHSRMRCKELEQMD